MMWRRVGLSAAAVIVALFVAYIALVIWQDHVAGNNQRKATADAEASARRFAGVALTAAKQGHVTTDSLRTLNNESGLGMILVRQSGSRVTVTFEVTKWYVIPGFTSESEVERCYTETIDRSGSNVTASTADLNCARIPVSGP
jgi:hypothetical protein